MNTNTKNTLESSVSMFDFPGTVFLRTTDYRLVCKGVGKTLFMIIRRVKDLSFIPLIT